MTKIGKKSDFTTRLIQWIARGISTLFIVFILLMGIGSAIWGSQNRIAPWPTLEDLVIIVFLLAMLVSVILAWRREGIGGFMLTIVGLVAIVVIMLINKPEDYWVALAIGVPFLVSGILYIICWKRIIKSKTPQDSAL